MAKSTGMAYHSKIVYVGVLREGGRVCIHNGLVPSTALHAYSPSPSDMHTHYHHQTCTLTITIRHAHSPSPSDMHTHHHHQTCTGCAPWESRETWLGHPLGSRASSTWRWWSGLQGDDQNGQQAPPRHCALHRKRRSGPWGVHRPLASSLSNPLAKGREAGPHCHHWHLKHGRQLCEA